MHPSTSLHGGDVSARRLNIDVTDTLAMQEWTGIQRIVRKLAAEIGAIARERGEDFRLLAAVDGAFHELNDEGVRQLFEPHRSAHTPLYKAKKRRFNPGRLLYGFPKVFVALQGVKLRRMLKPRITPFITHPRVTFDRRDIIFLPDTFFAGTTSVVAASRARATGATSVLLVHDLIPVTHPDVMVRQVQIGFPVKLLDAAKRLDGILTYSRDCAQELGRFLAGRATSPIVRTFQLGSDFAEVPDLEPERAQGAHGLGYVMVGTIEPRKGHVLALDAFEQMWAQGSQATLTFVGRMGWVDPGFAARLEGHPERGKRFHPIHDADDQRLAAILAGTDAAIMASRVEGFGLPLVEALAADKPVLASDIAVFHEIAGDHVLYFDHRSPASLAEAVRAFEADPDLYRRKAQSFRWINWHESAQQAVACLTEIADVVAAQQAR